MNKIISKCCRFTCNRNLDWIYMWWTSSDALAGCKQMLHKNKNKMGCLRTNTRTQVNTGMNTRYRLNVGTQLSRPENTTNLGKLQGLGPIKHKAKLSFANLKWAFYECEKIQSWKAEHPQTEGWLYSFWSGRSYLKRESSETSEKLYSMFVPF